MEKPPRPGDLITLDPDRCIELFEAAPWVRIGFVTDGAPSILPINVLLYDDAIFFRTAPGSKLGTAAASGTVAIEADGGDEEARVGWSVLARGEASIVTDPDVKEALFALPFEPWALPDENFFWVRIDVASISGRQIVRE